MNNIDLDHNKVRFAQSNLGLIEMPSFTSLHHLSYIKRIFLFSINLLPLKVEFSCYIRFKVCASLKEKKK